MCIEAVTSPVKNRSSSEAAPPCCERDDAGTWMNYEKLLNRIYGAVADPALWSETLASVADHVGSIAGMLIYNAPPGGKNLIVLARLNPDLVEIFHKHHVWNAESDALRTGFRRKPDSIPMIADSR
jgi:hypothetical protein